MAVRQNVIKIGSRDNPTLELDNGELISVYGQLACDLLCEEIPVDTLEIQCRYDRLRQSFAPSDYDGLLTADGLALMTRSAVTGVPDIPYATGLWYFNDDKYIGKFYVSDAKRTGKNVYTITAQSAMGVLDGMTYYGGLMLNTPLADALRAILLTDGLRDTSTAFLTALYASLTLADGLTAQTVTGWIPVCTKREALHHILFACGLNIFKAENDAFLIGRVSGSTAGSIASKHTYDSGSVDITDRVKRVEVTEHSFVDNPNAEATVLYDNTESAMDTEAVVCFDCAPVVVDTAAVTGTLQIKQINVNAAVVTGVGTLTGKPYAHLTQTIARDNPDIPDGQTVAVTDATCVNALNANAVADRCYAYHTSQKPVQMGFVLGGEQCGRRYQCTSPYAEQMEGYISAMRITASAIAKAECTIIGGYVPPTYASEFSHVILLTGSGTFTVPDVVFAAQTPRIRVVLIGGGSGGAGGNPGKDGKSKIVDSVDDLAEPGSRGANGTPGRRVVAQIEGSKIQRTYTYTCGAGGEGGQGGASGGSGAAGSSGGTTVLRHNTGVYATFEAAIPEAGYLDIITGRVYGGYAPDYADAVSGRGGGYFIGDDAALLLEGYVGEYAQATSGRYIVNEAVSKATGYAVGAVKGGSHGSRAGKIYRTFDGVEVEVAGGSGGGGPITAITKDPDKCSGTKSFFDGSDLFLGNGGNGADAPDAPDITSINALGYGMGGIGGMGGGGGGMAGIHGSMLPDSIKVYNGTPGRGGNGGKGGRGGPGCILVYY